MEGAPTRRRTWAFVLLAALTITFGALALMLPGSGRPGTAGVATSPVLTFDGAFSWRITTAPRRVLHGRPMHFDITVTTPAGLLPDYDLGSLDYGDGSGMFATVDYDAGGPRPCQPSDFGTPPRSQSPLGASQVSAAQSPMSSAEHTYRKPGRYTVAISYGTSCLPFQHETVRYPFAVG